MSTRSHLEIVPLGGLGEFGMNLMVYRFGRDCVVVDAGMMFPSAEHLGIDIIVPDMTFLDGCGTIHGVVLTHGHEDHIGALPFLLGAHDVPVYGSRYTLELVRHRLARHEGLGDDALRPLPPDGQPLRLGPFTVETLHAAHSIPDCRMVVVRTPVGTVVHTADFKLDPAPVDDRGTDLGRLAELGREGVLALLADSTNADRPGFTPGERTVGEGLDRFVADRRRRVIVTTFASNIHRLQQLAALARRHGRRLALVGTALETHCDIAERTGMLSLPPGLRVAPDRVDDLPPDEALVVVTGSQGEPLSALARMAVDEHRDVSIREGDLVIHSARVIPGNEKSIGRMFDHLLRRGAEVVTAADAPVHVSGHAAREELGVVVQLVRPRFYVPIHGDYRQLRANARLARDRGLDASSVLVAESGDVIALSADTIGVEGRVHVGRRFLDTAFGEVDADVLRDRRRSAGDGIVVVVVEVDRDSGVVNGAPEIVSRGFVPDTDDDDGLVRDARSAVVEALAAAGPEELADEGLVRARIVTAMKRFLRRRTQRHPLIIPVVLEP